MTRTKTQISILGCGWLGLPLAEALIKAGYTVKGSSTRTSRMEELSQKGIIPFGITAREDFLEGPVEDFLLNSHILIINIPPGLRKASNRNFTRVLRPVLTAAEKARIPHVLYISSTSVFPDLEQTFTETDPFKPDTPAGKQLVAAEHMVKSCENRAKHTILRFGGLLGEERHPVRFLSGKTGLPGANNRINLIHRDDCIRLITGIISRNLWGHTLHGVAPCHISKKEFYTLAAKQMNLTPPEYSPAVTGKGKLISTNFTDHLLNEPYLHPLCDAKKTF